MLKHFIVQLILLIILIYTFYLLMKFGEINIEIWGFILNPIYISLYLLVLLVLTQITLYFKINMVLIVFYIQIFLLIQLYSLNLQEYWILTKYIKIKMIFSKDILEEFFDKYFDKVLSYYVNEKMITNKQVIIINNFLKKTDYSSIINMKVFIIDENRSLFLANPIQVINFQIQLILKTHYFLLSNSYYYFDYPVFPSNNIFYKFIKGLIIASALVGIIGNISLFYATWNELKTPQGLQKAISIAYNGFIKTKTKTTQKPPVHILHEITKNMANKELREIIIENYNKLEL